MIYDFGCRSSADMLANILPALGGAVACIVVIAGLAVLGRLFRKTPGFEAADILCGWGVVTACLTVAVVLFPQPLKIGFYIVTVAMLLAAIPTLRQKYFHAPFWCLVFVPGLIVLTAMNIAGIGKWDDFSHWVPNALYLYHYDGVPGRDLPASTSAWPGYPYALPFLTYLASHLAGGFLVAGGAMINFLMLMVFAAMLVEIKPALPQSFSLRTWGWLGFALLAVTLLNPNFNASFTMTSQGDTPTMVAVGALGLMLWKLIPALQKKGIANRRVLILQILLTSMLLVLIKQGNLALLGLLLIGFVIAGWKNGIMKPAMLMALCVGVAALLFRSIWQVHMDSEIAGNGFSLKPLGTWHWDLLGPLFKAMKHEAIKKSGCFALVLIAVVYGVIGLFQKPDRICDFAILAGTVALGYLGFLIVCYLGTSFHEREIREAASFYRYMTHTGLLDVSLMWIAAPRFWGWLKAKTGHVSFPVVDSKAQVAFSVLLMLILPLCLLVKPGVLLAKPNALICDMRRQARGIAQTLPPQTRLAIFEPESDGMFTYVTAFELALEDKASQHTASVVWSVNQFNPAMLTSREKEIENGKDIDAVYALKAQKLPFSLVGQSNQRASIFLVRDGQEWKPVVP